MTPVGFEPAIPAIDRPHTYTRDRTATGTGWEKFKDKCERCEETKVMATLKFLSRSFSEETEEK